MTNNDWLINIENCIDTICSRENGRAIVESVLQRFEVESIYDLQPSSYPEVFSELYAIETDK